jgi:hypothetical protein
MLTAYLSLPSRQAGSPQREPHWSNIRSALNRSCHDSSGVMVGTPYISPSQCFSARPKSRAPAGSFNRQFTWRHTAGCLQGAAAHLPAETDKLNPDQSAARPNHTAENTSDCGRCLGRSPLHPAHHSCCTTTTIMLDAVVTTPANGSVHTNQMLTRGPTQLLRCSMGGSPTCTRGWQPG